MSFMNRRAGRLVGRSTAVAATLALTVLGGGAASAVAGAGRSAVMAQSPVVPAGETVGGITTVDDTVIRKASSTGSQIIRVLDNDTGASLSLVSVVGATGAEKGSVSIQGSWISYVGVEGFVGVDEFIYTVQDSGGQTATGRLRVLNRPPAPAPDLEATVEMTPWNGTPPDGMYTWTQALIETPEWSELAAEGLLADSPVLWWQNDQGSPTSSLVGDFGVVAVTADSNLEGKSLVFAGAPGWYGTVTLQYQVVSTGETSVGTVTLHVVPPRATATAVTTFGTPVRVPVLDELDTEGWIDSLQAAPSHGSVVLEEGPSGEAVYTPEPGFVGVDTFTVRLLTDGEFSDYTQPLDVVVTVTVKEPMLTSDQTAYNTAKTVDVLASTGLESLSSIAATVNGTAEIVDGKVVYTPNPGFVGEDTVTVMGLDADGAIVPVIVTITVGAPDSIELAAATPFETPVAVDVVTDAGVESVNSVGQGANGTVAIVDGEVVYTPNPGFFGEDEFTVTGLDEFGTPVEVVVSVTVGAPFEVATDTDYNTPVDVDVLGESGGTEITGAGQADNGTVTVNPDGTVTYTPNPGFVGEDSYPVSVIDEDGNPATVIVTVTVAGPEPVDVATSTPFETPVSVDVLGETGAESITSVGQPENGTAEIVDGEVVYTPNPGFVGVDEVTVTVTDEYGNDVQVTIEVTVGDVVKLATETDYNTPVIVDPVAETDGGTVSEVTDGDNGTVTINDDGTVTYTPNPGFVGEDQFTVIVTDENGDSTAVVVDVTVGGPEDTTVDAGTDYNTPVEVDVTENDGDTVTGATDGDNGTVTVNPDGTVTYTPNPGFVGDDEFTVTVTDEFGNEHDVTVTVTVDGPPAIEIADSTGYETPKVIEVPDGATDVTNGNNGTVTLNPDGTVTYTPNPGFSGEDSFTVTVVDEFGTEREVVVTVTVGDPARVDLASETPFETSKTIDILGETGAESISSVTQGQNGTVTIVDGKVVYTPNPGFSGTDTFTVTVINADGTRTVVTITMTVGDPAAAPGDTGNGAGSRVLAVTGSPAGITVLLALAAGLVGAVLVALRRRGTARD
ncbi:Ig-like domain-containing protein [Cellulomonas sp. NPDC089187]|uniref:Ig-like domain-containing protein n=1 Tax=Cellulomonas sp. NPDC089187 TaxID=3154970 RepID=UPI0034407A19